MHEKMSCFINLLSQTNVWRIIETEGSTKYLRKFRKYRTQDGNKHYNEKREKLNSKAYNLVAIIQCVHVQSEQKERKHFKS